MFYIRNATDPLSSSLTLFLESIGWDFSRLKLMLLENEIEKAEILSKQPTAFM